MLMVPWRRWMMSRATARPSPLPPLVVGAVEAAEAFEFPLVLVITDPRTAQPADLFNAVYETTLQALRQYFVYSRESAEQLTTLATVAKHLMNWVLRR
jgi:hypothetical protein